MSRLKTEMHPNLTEDIIKALNAKNIYNILNFVSEDIQNIVKITRLTFREILNIRKSLLNEHSPSPLNALNCYRNVVKNSALIPTGIQSVDTLLLEGGLFTGNIYEICGLPASGKTQFCLTLTKNVVVNLKQNIYYLDTKHNFVGRRMKEILNTCNDPNSKDELMEFLNRILVKRINTKYELINSLYEIKDQLMRDDNSLKLRVIVIDSLPILILHSTDFSENNSFFNHLANVMKFMAVELNVIFLVTNILTTWNDGDFKNQQTTKENVACGKYWQSIPNTRLKIEKNKNSFNVSLVKSDVVNSYDSVNVQITNQGIVSVT